MPKYTDEQLHNIAANPHSNADADTIKRLVRELLELRKGSHKLRGYQINALQNSVSRERRIRASVTNQRNILLEAIKPNEYPASFSINLDEATKILGSKNGGLKKLQEAEQEIRELVKRKQAHQDKEFKVAS